MTVQPTRLRAELPEKRAACDIVVLRARMQALASGLHKCHGPYSFGNHVIKKERGKIPRQLDRQLHLDSLGVPDICAGARWIMHGECARLITIFGRDIGGCISGSCWNLIRHVFQAPPYRQTCQPPAAVRDPCDTRRQFQPRSPHPGEKRKCESRDNCNIAFCLFQQKC